LSGWSRARAAPAHRLSVRLLHAARLSPFDLPSTRTGRVRPCPAATDLHPGAACKTRSPPRGAHRHLWRTHPGDQLRHGVEYAALAARRRSRGPAHSPSLLGRRFAQHRAGRTSAYQFTRHLPLSRGTLFRTPHAFRYLRVTTLHRSRETVTRLLHGNGFIRSDGRQGEVPA